MKQAVDVVRGEIVDVSDNGTVTIKARYDDWYTLCKRQYRECYVEMIDSRKLSDKQRRMCYALIGAVAEYMGEDKGETKAFLKLDFMINELGETCDRLFSFANAPMSLVCAFQRYLVRFIIRHDIPTKFSLLEYADDITDYVYACLINKKCCICGKKADLHHVQRVGMGRDRREIIHEGMEALPLCREHHTEDHSIGEKRFMERYHLNGGINLDRTLCRIYKLKGGENVKSHSNNGPVYPRPGAQAHPGGHAGGFVHAGS